MEKAAKFVKVREGPEGRANQHHKKKHSNNQGILRINK
ncbi:hypothetical protein SACC_28170 [Saccharolobus caldissimus]|uniref:Uncharacterized protein n=1 Tax=Saccharolobus caldissimus TaxID=1702097 RepID=A0AAQ4CU75_9CREN|nr:hypothetical protein SACC_23730 [Saccharolobus caldissimus]BDB99800.1 hypothetical protein SACC_28170 [Saccharolobus caldissimus]